MKAVGFGIAALVVIALSYGAFRALSGRHRRPGVPRTRATSEAPLSAAAERFLARAREEYNAKQPRFDDRWLKDCDRYDIDTHAGELVLKRGDTRTVFDAQLLGSVCKTDSTWEWAWNNPNVPERVSRASAALKEVGAKYDLPYLQQGTVPVPDEEFPWLLGAIALKVTRMEGIFRAPSGEMEYYFLLANPRQTATQPGNPGQYAMPADPGPSVDQRR